MLDSSFIYLDEQTIKSYVRKYGKKLLGKDYELACAILLKNFFERVNNFPCVIGIKLNPKYYSHSVNRTGPLNIDEAKDLIELYNQEDDPVDFSISPVPSFREDKNSAWIFQIKRFGHFQKEKTTDGLIKYLAKIKDSYASTSAILVIFLDGHQGISLKRVFEYMSSIKFPFPKAMFIEANKNEEGAWKIRIGELWPNRGFNEYDPEDLKESTWGT